MSLLMIYGHFRKAHSRRGVNRGQLQVADASIPADLVTTSGVRHLYSEKSSGDSDKGDKKKDVKKVAE